MNLRLALSPSPTSQSWRLIITMESGTRNDHANHNSYRAYGVGAVYGTGGKMKSLVWASVACALCGSALIESRMEIMKLKHQLLECTVNGGAR